MSTPAAHWLPRANGDHGRGELVRRSFEDRLQRREDEPGDIGVRLLEQLERLRVADYERRAALVALSEAPAGARELLAQVLALPPRVQDLLCALFR